MNDKKTQKRDGQNNISDDGMNVLRDKTFVGKPEKYQTKGTDKGNGVAQNDGCGTG